MMEDVLVFATREEFHAWLEEHCLSSEGVWLLFGKAKGPKTLKASEALEEALCFGWIDGLMCKIDDTSYKKYFSMRRKNSKWSEKNKGIVEQLEKQGRMQDVGREKIAEAKANGQWDAPKANVVDESHIAMLTSVLEGHEPAYTNFIAMSPSVKKTYTKAYLDAKTEDGKKKRIAWIIERLNKNLKPM